MFSEGHYYSKLGWRRSLDRLFEGHVLKDASGLVTVSEPWAQILEERHAPPVCVIRNGYDTKDFENLEAPPEQAPGRLQLFYGGSLYGGLRDPKLLFEALELLGEEAASIDINFFVGTACQNVVNGIAERYKFKAKLQALPLIAHKESLKEQQRSDVLLLIEADLDTTEGVLAAKVFEYFAARRRIVILGGRQDSVASKAVLNKQAGAHPLSAAELAETLREWGSLKREGRLGRLPASVSEGFSREEQVRKLEGFLSARLGAH